MNDNTDNLYEKSVEYILKMPKTEKQVRIWYSKKTADKNYIDDCIDRLKSYNFINDEEYAAAFVQCKKEKMGAGMIKSKLYQNGISSSIVEKIMSHIGEQKDLVLLSVEKYMKNKSKTPETKNKLFRWLLSKGLDYEACGEVISEYWDRY